MTQPHAVTIVSVIMSMLNDGISVFATFSALTENCIWFTYLFLCKT